MKTLKHKILATNMPPLYMVMIVLLFSTLTFVLLHFSHVSFLYSINTTILMTLIALIGLIDLRTKVIPNELIIIGIVIRLIIYIYCAFNTTLMMRMLIIDNLIAAFVSAFIFLIGRLLKMGVGAGDIKLFFMIGLYLGFQDTFNALFYSVLAMFLFSIVALLTKKMKVKDELAMAPFVVIGLSIMLLIKF